IKENKASRAGGGIYIGAKSVTYIYNNTISDNSSDNFGGGGISLWSGTIYYGTYSYIFNNLIVNNIATCSDDSCGGGGIYCRYDTSQIYNNTIFENQAYRGGGMYVVTYDNLPPVVTNCIFWENKAIKGSEIQLESSSGSSADITYCDIMGGWLGKGNIDENPIFVSPENGDFHLTYSSPCIDLGNDLVITTSEDFEGDPRIAEETVDIGADEFYPHLYYTGDATPSGTIQAKFVGIPGNWIDAVIMGNHIFEQPLPSNYGLWYLNDPMQIIIGLGTIPANGIAVIPGTLHPSTPTLSTIYLQAAIDMKLTGLCTVNVQ
ncbi:MAG: right-handed parallel beta-helix repeat-containing protein, partial [Thermodesulfobacteriota bacterium]|nr:right-handed parallel beta-helix repeat-containing protein [Thermodesulfobacteriota bacterium]